MTSNILPLHLKKTFPPVIWIFAEGEGDGIESRLPFRIFSTLLKSSWNKKDFNDIKAAPFLVCFFAAGSW